jgi:hypothetical protein
MPLIFKDIRLCVKIPQHHRLRLTGYHCRGLRVIYAQRYPHALWETRKNALMTAAWLRFLAWQGSVGP